MNVNSCYLLFFIRTTRGDFKLCKYKRYNIWYTIITWQKISKLRCGRLPKLNLYGKITTSEAFRQKMGNSVDLYLYFCIFKVGTPEYNPNMNSI
jgi:hypothetical protein